MYKKFIENLEANYVRVFNYTGGHPDLRIVALIAAQYTFANAIYKGVEQQKVLDRLHKSSPLFDLHIRGEAMTLYEKLACHIILSEQSFEEQMQHLQRKNKILEACGFKKSPYRLASALFVEDMAHGIRAKGLYDAMQKNQPFLTRKSDFPFVVLLTLEEGKDVQTQADTVHQYFKQLREEGFKMSDTLQTLAQVLTLFDIHARRELVQYVVKIKETLQQADIKVRKMHYPYIGILALAATNNTLLEEVIRLEQQLRQTKALKGTKELALMLAIQCVVRENEKEQDVVTTTQFTHWTELFNFNDLFFDTFIPESISGFFEF